jgi:hypothetical protein
LPGPSTAAPIRRSATNRARSSGLSIRRSNDRVRWAALTRSASGGRCDRHCPRADLQRPGCGEARGSVAVAGPLPRIHGHANICAPPPGAVITRTPQSRCVHKSGGSIALRTCRKCQSGQAPPHRNTRGPG